MVVRELLSRRDAMVRLAGAGIAASTPLSAQTSSAPPDPQLEHAKAFIAAAKRATGKPFERLVTLIIIAIAPTETAFPCPPRSSATSSAGKP